MAALDILCCVHVADRDSRELTQVRGIAWVVLSRYAQSIHLLGKYEHGQVSPLVLPRAILDETSRQLVACLKKSVRKEKGRGFIRRDTLVSKISPHGTHRAHTSWFRSQ